VAGEIRHAASASEAERRFPVIRGKVSTWDNEDPEKFGRNVNRYAKNLDHLGEVAIAPIHNLRTDSSKSRDEARRLIAAGYTLRIFNDEFHRDLEYWKQ
jgi:hypothetical protein